MSENLIRLPQFLSQTDELTSQLSAEQLRTFIHEVARTFPEEKRASFITKLQEIKNAKKSGETEMADHEAIKQEIQQITKKLTKIQNEEICLDSEFNEEWDDWNGSEEEEFLFSDPKNLLKDVRQAMRMLHTCIDKEFWEKDAIELVEFLSLLAVSAEGNYQDYDGSPLNIQDLYECGLLKGDYHKFVNECLYLSYMGTQVEKRPEKLYEIIKNLHGECLVRLEEVMQLGNGELPESDRFLRDWIRYLGNQEGKWTEGLLIEAQSMISDDEVLLENARAFAKTHPSLYLGYLKDRDHLQNAETLLEIGCEALAAIPVSYVIRAQVALLTAGYANQLQQWEKAEWCWLETFRSDTSVVNYLRLRFETADWGQYREKIRNMIEEQFQKEKPPLEWGAAEECQKNMLSRDAYCTMMFWEQDFERMRTTGMATRSALGWSGTFMKEGISLMTLLLYTGSAEYSRLPVGLQEMRQRAVYACDFRPELYAQGKDQERSFDELFARWKSSVSLKTEEQQCWLQRIDQWMECRIQGIMQANRRNYYEECVAFLAALCEVLESRGEHGAKERYFERYRSKYPRRRAFIDAMRQYGMK